MKVKRLFVLSAAIALVMACEMREPEDVSLFPENLVEIEDPEGQTFLFSSEPETKTIYTGGTILWSKGDMIRMAFKVGNSWAGANGTLTTSYSSAKIYASNALSSGGETAEFSVPTNFTGTQTGNYTFYTVYPSSVCGTGFTALGKVSANLPANQTPPDGSFDPKADLMVGTSPVTYTSKPTGAVPLMWTRLVSHADITLKNIKNLTAGETVTSVTLTAQDGCVLTGTHTLDITNGNMTATSGSSYNSVTIKGDNLSFSGGNLEFWACILPVTITSLDVTLVTSRGTYTRSISGIQIIFKANAHCTLGINMANCTPPAEEETEVYRKVTSAPSDWSGDYLIVYEDGSKALDGSLTTLDASGNTITVTISDGEIEATDYNKARQFTISKSGSSYTIKSTSGYYIGNTANSNTLASSTSTAYTNTITLGSNGVDIKASGGSYLRYNKQSGQERFRYFKSSSYTSQEPIALYKLTGSSGGGNDPDPETFSATLFTLAATSITTNGAVLNASYSGVSTTRFPQNVVFKYGTSQSNLNQTVGNIDISSVSGNYSWPLTELTPGQTYYFRASMDVWNPETSQYQTITGSILNFTTNNQSQSSNAIDWAELPALDYTHYTSSGNYYIDNSTHSGKYTSGSLYYTHHWTDVKYSGTTTYLRNYTCCWSSAYKCPVWIAAPRHSCYTGNSGRTDAYKKNPDMPSGIQYSGTSANNSSYNRGHMLGSAERTLSKLTNNQVFYTTNIAPQNSSYFNTGGGGWNKLEDWVDGKVCSDTLYIVIGCLFNQFTDGYGNTASPSTISFMGTSGVACPTAFYYALLRTKSGNSGKSVKNCSANELQCAAFIRAHASGTMGQAVTAAEMKTIAELESLTGFTFFDNVPNAPKTTKNASDWGL